MSTYDNFPDQNVQMPMSELSWAQQSLAKTSMANMSEPYVNQL